jgi:2-keto-3-deoxy-L-rhamnonate aldolase RhmA
MTQEKTLKQRIHDGEVVNILRVAIDTEQEVLKTALEQTSYDLLYVDGQHTAFTEQELVAFCGMAETLGLPVQMRIPHTRHTYLIGRYLDFGLSSVLVPEVVNVASVDEAIAYSYYPQVGKRSWGGSARYGLSSGIAPVERLEYVDWWNQHIVLGIQLESVEAINHARHLAKKGLDYIAFGPTDLTFSLEGHPDYPFRTADECMQNVADQLQGTGVKLGMAVTTTPEEREKYLKMGVTVFMDLL